MIAKCSIKSLPLTWELSSKYEVGAHSCLGAKRLIMKDWKMSVAGLTPIGSTWLLKNHKQMMMHKTFFIHYTVARFIESCVEINTCSTNESRLLESTFDCRSREFAQFNHLIELMKDDWIFPIIFLWSTEAGKDNLFVLCCYLWACLRYWYCTVSPIHNLTYQEVSMGFYNARHSMT